MFIHKQPCKYRMVKTLNNVLSSLIMQVCILPSVSSQPLNFHLQEGETLKKRNLHLAEFVMIWVEFGVCFIAFIGSVFFQCWRFCFLAPLSC